MGRLRFLTAGESHGPELLATLEGIPAGLPLLAADIDADLARRQRGYGRGARMKIEHDRVRFVGGVRGGETLGSPIALVIENRDHASWTGSMTAAPFDAPPDPLTRPRPGHADLAGGLKYDRKDLRDILERASARETAARVAAGAVCKKLLAAAGIDVFAHVLAIGPAAVHDDALSLTDLRGHVPASGPTAHENAVSLADLRGHVPAIGAAAHDDALSLADLRGHVPASGPTAHENAVSLADLRDHVPAIGAAAHDDALSLADLRGHVPAIGAAARDDAVSLADLRARARASDLACADPAAEEAMRAAIREAAHAGDTLGGVFEVVATGVPPGLGSHVAWDRKLDGRIAQALMSIPAIKGVEIGPGFDCARRPGSDVHDLIEYDDAAHTFTRPTNKAGGLEGGITNGMPVRVRAAMKPISTLKKPLASVDIRTKQPFEAAFERSDVCAVPAASVVGEAMLAIVLADALLEKLGGDSLTELTRNLQGYREQLGRY